MTTQTQHTKGPWIHNKGSQSIMTADGIDLAYFAGLVAGPDNAQLASAAPDMLAALERMLAAHDADVEAGSLIAAGNGMAAAQARQAIAKATGKAA